MRLKLVLELALLDAVLPLAAVEGRLRLVEQRAVVVGSRAGRGQPWRTRYTWPVLITT
jgi:hypothetical protein